MGRIVVIKPFVHETRRKFHEKTVLSANLGQIINVPRQLDDISKFPSLEQAQYYIISTFIRAELLLLRRNDEIVRM